MKFFPFQIRKFAGQQSTGDYVKFQNWYHRLHTIWGLLETCSKFSPARKRLEKEANICILNLERYGRSMDINDVKQGERKPEPNRDLWKLRKEGY